MNNAGSTGDISKRIGEYPEEELAAYFNANVTSVAIMTCDHRSLSVMRIIYETHCQVGLSQGDGVDQVAGHRQHFLAPRRPGQQSLGRLLHWQGGARYASRRRRQGRIRQDAQLRPGATRRRHAGRRPRLARRRVDAPSVCVTSRKGPIEDNVAHSVARVDAYLC